MFQKIQERISEDWSFAVVVIEFCAGGNVVLLYAAKYNDVQTVVNISGRFFLDRGIEFRLGKDYFKRIKDNGSTLKEVCRSGE